MALRLLKADAGERHGLWHRLVAELPREDAAALIVALEDVDGDRPGDESAPPERPPAGLHVVSPDPSGADEGAVSISTSIPSGGRIVTRTSYAQPMATPTTPTILPIGAYPGWPEPLGPAALRGFAGQVVEQIAPTTEADPTAVLVQLLVAFGNLVGRGPYIGVDGHEHHANLFAVIVGDTSRAREGDVVAAGPGGGRRLRPVVVGRAARGGPVVGRGDHLGGPRPDLRAPRGTRSSWIKGSPTSGS